jgi:carbonyl reductase 1
MQTILVTGANTGIGLSLCKQLCKDHGAKVFLGSRSVEKGEAAVKEVKEHAGADANVELLQVDVGNDDSVQKAANVLKEKGVILTAIVNNAGTGLAHGVTDEMVMNVNLMGPKRVVDSFQGLLDPAGSKIVNVGSGAGPMYVRVQPVERQTKLCSPDVTWEEIKANYDRGVPPEDPANGGMASYGLSKALLSDYTMLLARELASKNVLAYCLSPGYIETNITSGFGGNKKPVEEGTVSIRYCLFEAGKEETGWFFGSDAKRSPLHFMRNPGEPAFDGVVDWDAVAKK